MKLSRTLGTGILLAALVGGCGGSDGPAYLSNSGNGTVTTSTGSFTQTTVPDPSLSPSPSPSASPTSTPTPPPAEVVTEEDGLLLSYRASNGWQIRLVSHSHIYIDDPSDTSYISYGLERHEYLNGKHIKDFNGTVRTVILPGGVKVTFETSQPGANPARIQNYIIYDGTFNAVVKPTGMAHIRRGTTGEDTVTQDRARPDGETATLDPAPTVPGGVTYNNAYFEDDNFVVTELLQKLGETGGTANPNRVTDFYDDPNRSNT